MDISFKTVPWIESGLGKISLLPEICKKLKVKKPIIISDNGLYKLGYIEKITNILRKNNLQSCMFKDVLADPPEHNIFDALKIFEASAADGIIGFGGGSSMDVAKALSYFSINKIPIDKCYGINKLENKRVPLIQIPTTAGTGSEVTPIAIFTLKSQQKMGIVDPLLYADSTILDADLTLELPNHITAYSGIDAMVHAIEAYTTKLKKNPLSDLLAKKALSLLGANIKTVVADPHALAYPIGAKFHVPHGLSNSLVLPKVLSFNAKKAEDMYCEIACDCLPDLKGKKIKIDDFIIGIEELIDGLNIPKRLKDVGINHNDIPMLAEDAMKQERLLVNNPRELNIEDVKLIYRNAL